MVIYKIKKQPQVDIAAVSKCIGSVDPEILGQLIQDLNTLDAHIIAFGRPMYSGIRLVAVKHLATSLEAGSVSKQSAHALIQKAITLLSTR